MNSTLLKLNYKDLSKAFAMAAFAGALAPVLVMFQDQSFNVFTADWNTIFHLMVNGAMTGFVSYLVKNFFSDSEGKLFGRIG